MLPSVLRPSRVFTQAKPKAYIITESEVLDAGALAAYISKLRDVQKAHGARLVVPAGGSAAAGRADDRLPQELID